MAIELVVREPFGLSGTKYVRGQHITDATAIAAVQAKRGAFVRAVTVPDPAPAAEPAAPAEEAH